MKTAVVVLIAILCNLTLVHQLFCQPEHLWTKRYNKGAREIPKALIPLPDGGLVVAGISYANEHDEAQALATRIDSDGNVFWSVSFGQNGFREQFYGGYLLDNSIFLIGAVTILNTSFILQLSMEGEKIDLWTDAMFMPDFVTINGFRKTTEGGYMFGYVDDRLYLARLSESGRIIWSKYYPDLGDVTPSGMVEDANNSIIIAGRVVHQNENEEAIVIKIDQNGEVVWKREFGGPNNDAARSLTRLNTGELVVQGSYQPLGREEGGGGYTMLLDGDNNLIRDGWVPPYEGTLGSTLALGESDFCFCTLEDSLYRFDREFNLRWKTPGKLGNSFHFSIVKTLEGGYWLSDWGGNNEYSISKFACDPLNNAPIWGKLDPVSFPEDQVGIVATETLLAKISDEDNEIDEIRVTADNSRNCVVDLNDNRLAITPKRFFAGKDSIRLTATDPGGFATSTYLRITVTPVNNPPLPAMQIFPKDSTALTNNSTVFCWTTAVQNQWEVDSVRYTLVIRYQQQEYRYNRLTDTVLTVRDILTVIDEITPEGIDPVVPIRWSVIASDREEHIPSIREFRITYGKPLWRSLPVWKANEDETLRVSNATLNSFVYDPDTPSAERLFTTANGRTVSSAVVNGEIVITAPPNWWGKDTVKLVVSDPENNSKLIYNPIEFFPINDPPGPFELRLPANGSVLQDVLVSFVWNSSSHAEYELDSIRYRLSVRIQDSIFTVSNLKDRTYIMEDILEVVDQFGYQDAIRLDSVVWWVTAFDRDTAVECSQRFAFNSGSVTGTRPGKSVSLPSDFAITTLYPNPFNYATTLEYTLPGPGTVELIISDVRGRAVLYQNNLRSTGGTFTQQLDVSRFGAGVYLLRLQYGGKVEHRKIVHLR